MEGSSVRYRNLIMDSARWEGFAFRPDDILICTPPKCGTTWTQMICALLIFRTAEFPQPLDQLSPWFDQTVRNRDDMVAALEAQRHRRFIKSHTPLDGLPWDDRVTYICVSRDPRDVGLSMDNHLRNMDWETVLALREAAVGNEDLAEVLPNGFTAPPESEHERMWHWLKNPDPLRGLAFTLHHISTFWEVRDRPNVVMLRYEDLKADLVGQMRALAERLGLDVPSELLPELAEAATFERMRDRARDYAPNATNSIWRDTTRFFNQGRSGQWQRLFDEDDLRRYAALVDDLIDRELSEWIHRGPVIR